MAEKVYKVHAPMVALKTEDERVVQFYAGAAVPAGGLDKDSVKHNLELGLITEDEGDAEPSQGRKRG